MYLPGPPGGGGGGGPPPTTGAGGGGGGAGPPIGGGAGGGGAGGPPTVERYQHRSIHKCMYTYTGSLCTYLDQEVVEGVGQVLPA